MHRICCKHALQGRLQMQLVHFHPQRGQYHRRLNYEDCEFGAKIEIRIVLTCEITLTVREIDHTSGFVVFLHGVPAERDEQWGYALTMAQDDYKDDIELIPNLRPLHNGADVIGPDGTYYMGDSVQSSQLDAMIDRDEPLPVGLVDLGEVDPLITWFSEDEGSLDSGHDEW
ncbi:hypothetical protein B0H14DRAFT_2597662 [Mycena olivaceomarginata]|nr:hypothetical protein B0H14DRAFT_2597662 [Mycena olivaceomarginata]